VNQQYPVTVVNVETGEEVTLEPNGPWWALPLESSFRGPSRVVLDRETGEFILVDRSVIEMLFFAEYGEWFYEAESEEGEV